MATIMQRRMLSILLTRPEDTANVLSMLADISEFVRSAAENQQYIVQVIGPGDCITSTIQQAVVDFDEEHPESADVEARPVRFVAHKCCSQAGAPDAFSSTINTAIHQAAKWCVDDLILVHGSLRLAFNHLSVESMVSALTGVSSSAGLVVGDVLAHESPMHTKLYGSNGTGLQTLPSLAYGAPVCLRRRAFIGALAAGLRYWPLSTSANPYTLPVSLALHAFAAESHVTPHVVGIPHVHSARILLAEARQRGEDPFAMLETTEPTTPHSVCNARAPHVLAHMASTCSRHHHKAHSMSARAAADRGTRAALEEVTNHHGPVKRLKSSPSHITSYRSTPLPAAIQHLPATATPSTACSCARAHNSPLGTAGFSSREYTTFPNPAVSACSRNCQDATSPPSSQPTGATAPTVSGSGSTELATSATSAAVEVSVSALTSAVLPVTPYGTVWREHYLRCGHARSRGETCSCDLQQPEVDALLDGNIFAYDAARALPKLCGAGA